MASLDGWPEPITAASVTVAPDAGMHVASLRYFVSDGSFAAALRRSLGLSLPLEPNSIELATAETFTLLAWRSPSEALLLSRDASLLAALSTASAGLSDGCAVDLTGGACVLQVSGTGMDDFFARIGGHDALPARRAAHASRVADLPVVLIRPETADVLMLVDRSYLAHLAEWMRRTAADL
jgi:heterotetrameric sarcosine oxidase gamma subunit